ncbi:MAG: flagellar hook assembly protein FlgD [Oleiphilaceae bacterium]|jgi:flagellar basal-body rod modification protein FlgD|uniref:Basal-body rod modification protein FlgD n=1 Tax=Marinobacter qingdaonensis TaxID=3108486 RepID=A0ABU5P2I0_9GAMM|nr:flagellar hook assembly protein FlgD [Marinobacter sp. ASW11-75]MCS5563368.1 flagellar hook assembly protein FlgD [Oleiphilaceae bacterium]MEA1082281.1 flagellar hook assembly protein FlgD [Marinobacter sp. ASW11-75]MEE2763919.1 flagellar hook assembly protein FlgD [Pseudomonadota bacterium]MEE3117715.1 flagellar hook assembly protein FlgD [Pseudomonadota bacterium]
MSAINATDASDVLSQYQLKQQGASGNSELGKNEFMELMLAQLKNQNPLEPQDNGEFISQLAQFSSLEEMQKLSGTVDDVVGQFRSTQALQASAMVGKTVLAPSSVGILGSEGEIRGTIEVPASTGGLRLSVQNQSGELVRQIDLGSSPAGVKSFSWDGQDGNGNPLPPGPYRVVAEASYPQGSQQLSTMVSANVDSVSLGQNGAITLNLAGMGSIALSDVKQIN